MENFLRINYTSLQQSERIKECDEKRKSPWIVNKNLRQFSREPVYGTVGVYCFGTLSILVLLVWSCRKMMVDIVGQNMANTKWTRSPLTKACKWSVTFSGRRVSATNFHELQGLLVGQCKDLDSSFPLRSAVWSSAIFTTLRMLSFWHYYLSTSSYFIVRRVFVVRISAQHMNQRTCLHMRNT